MKLKCLKFRVVDISWWAIGTVLQGQELSWAEPYEPSVYEERFVEDSALAGDIVQQVPQRSLILGGISFHCFWFESFVYFQEFILFRNVYNDYTLLVFKISRWILYQLSHKGSPRILERVAYSFSSKSSWPRHWTGVSCIAGRFFTNWVIKEAPKEKTCLSNKYWLNVWKWK